MMVHDTCLHDLPDVYPLRVRGYYLHMLKRNLKAARLILTVSQTSKFLLGRRYGIPDPCLSVVPNAIDPRMEPSSATMAHAKRLQQERGAGLHIFYPGGSEHRKNIARLAQAIATLSTEGANPQLWITGQRDEAWSKAIMTLSEYQKLDSCFHFLGRLSIESIAAEYLASNVVVYPTLCEGFGRVALEAMQMGKPLACSDIAVLREVAGDYPCYFDPQDSNAIATSLKLASASEAEPQSRHEYQPESVIKNFLSQMDAFIASV